ncbi:L-fucose mutarotase [Paenibacillus taihuensis]|uniref:L-fucose mutarotase n=1 Tax=Paenibacillus taihuensis TaxID=1156355 RepID=A0A3D9R2Q1_9BACL|nr:RbsD/FucU domain-containing protein [Paenibacillus taihuensis]REE69585.1 L-fucose mutarotase [Paenibacillus taihuensis]
MLIGISKRISPELIKILMEMGHGDELALADGNFPAASHAQRLIRCDGHSLPELLDDILQLFPLDRNAEHSIALMKVDPGDPVEHRRHSGIKQSRMPHSRSCLITTRGKLFKSIAII